MKRVKQDSRNIAESDFPYSKGRAEQLRFLVNYAVLAPSNHNSQPWKFCIRDDSMDVLIDKSRMLSFIDPHLRQMKMSCGAAIGHLEVAARYFGFEPIVKLLDFSADIDVVANISLGQKVPEDPQNSRLFKAIAKRQTNRRFFINQSIDTNLLAVCQELAADFDVAFTYLTSQEDKEQLANLTAVATRHQHNQPWFRREFSSRLRRHTSAKTGMSSFGFGPINVPTPIARFIMDLFNNGRSSAKFNRKKILEGSPSIGIFTTEVDEQEAWLNTGRALSLVLLELASQGLSASFLHQVIEVEPLRPQLSKIIRSQGIAQVMIRIGEASRVKHSMRRAVDQVFEQ